MRALQMLHAIPGRTRMRCHWLPESPDEAGPLAAALAAVPGVTEVRVQPKTGSVLCLHDPEVDARGLFAAARAQTRPRLVLGPEDELPLRPLPPGATTIARNLATLARELNQEVMRKSGGRVDLPTLATLLFAVAGALEVAVEEDMPLPPWFNLAWWAFRTFATMEEGAGAATAESPF